MKKIVYSILFLLLAVFTGCSEKDDLVFIHEIPQFELKDGKILVEVIVPQNTQATEQIAIAGAFNNNDVSLKNDKWTLQQSDATRYRWGIYLDPADFENGKTLADGFYFVAKTAGVEKTISGTDTLRTSNALVGTRIEAKILKWASDFTVADDPNGWPSVPAGKIMLKLELPEYTPSGVTLRLYGVINGWDGSSDKWKTTAISRKQHYIILNPSDFVEGTSLNDQFKFGLMQEGKEWWYHQSNEDGSGNDGAGYTVANTAAGESYTITIQSWRNLNELIWNNPPVDKIMLRLTLPDNTPDNATIKLYGNVNSWDGSDNKWKTTKVSTTQHFLLLDPVDFAEGKSLADEFKFGLIMEGKEWWYFQNNDDGSSSEVAGFTIADAAKGNAYDLTIGGWCRSSEL